MKTDLGYCRTIDRPITGQLLFFNESTDEFVPRFFRRTGAIQEE